MSEVKPAVVSSGGGTPFASPFSDKVRPKIEEVVDQCRADFISDVMHGQGEYDSYMQGSRFNSIDSLFYSIQTATSEEDFLSRPVEWVMAALRNAASSDHYYTYEKDYGEP